MTADSFRHICTEIPTLEATAQKFRDNKKMEVYRTTELPLGPPAQEITIWFRDQHTGRKQHQLKDKQDSG